MKNTTHNLSPFIIKYSISKIAKHYVIFFYFFYSPQGSIEKKKNKIVHKDYGGRKQVQRIIITDT